jgi:hypothetical protein
MCTSVSINGFLGHGIIGNGKRAKMGNSTSLPKVDGFSTEEVARLEKRFRKLDLVSAVLRDDLFFGQTDVQSYKHVSMHTLVDSMAPKYFTPYIYR